MKTRLKVTAGLVVLLLAHGLANAQLSIINTRPLAFGNFIAGSGGRVVVAPGGTRIPAASVVLLPSPASSADFLLRDTNPDNASNQVNITLPSGGSLVTTSGASMALVDFTSNNQPPSAQLIDGSMTLSIGASLVVSPNQPRGDYTGSIQITVVYQ